MYSDRLKTTKCIQPRKKVRSKVDYKTDVAFYYIKEELGTHIIRCMQKNISPLMAPTNMQVMNVILLVVDQNYTLSHWSRSIELVIMPLIDS
jgi:hypothetical protein